MPKVSSPCPECGKVFSYYASWPRIYCSHACAGKDNIRNIRKWKPTQRTATCEACGQTFGYTPARARGRFCSRRCWGDWLIEHLPRGSEHHNWRGGYEPYYGSNWRSVRRRIRDERGACEDCGKTAAELGRSLDVHHIRPFREFGRARYLEANDPSNLVALCNACHTAREWQTTR